MALAHAQPLDIIDVRPLGAGLRDAVTSSLLKTDAVQLMRLVLPAGHQVPEHRVPGPITLHGLEGEAVVTTASRTLTLHAGEVVVLDGGEPHVVRAVSDASLLVTVLLHTVERRQPPPS